MKHLLLICMAGYLLSCNPAMHITSTPVTTKSGSTILLGKIAPSALQQQPFSEWYNKEFAAYRADTQITDSLKPLAGDLQYEIFLGTWCGDSRREVPRLMKIMESLKIKPSAITMIAVGNRDTLYKQSPAHEEAGKRITRVPHLNIYRNGIEIGRITETPVSSWEKDMLTIMQGKPYKPKW